MTHSIFTLWEEDAMGVILGTGFMQFETASGIAGLAKVTGTELELLAVVASHPGTGQFRRFIASAKRLFSKVTVMHDMNPIVESSLTRYGFHREIRTLSDGEVVPCMIYP